MLKIDKGTFIYFRGRFAIIYVKIDLSKKLVPRILVLGMTLNIEYEWLHLIYFTCGKYGHRSELCGEGVVGEGDPGIKVATGGPTISKLFQNSVDNHDQGIGKKSPNGQ
ncbi:hypothetical protein Ahy_A07g031716 [Arachis hypogaea]|uniref:Zinc knuckle CX2CX4HX4C domain-containing protein n=1 Tax=Arachis hypogaea TaxID=3818 RepID=A0A445C4T1_ARAHY|nr:hypothetical protein Ahy_A07g031716 [Arachis hypogaea]